jgi:hypothetical protein
MGGRKVKWEEVASNKLGESSQVNLRRQPPLQRNQFPKPFTRIQDSMEPRLGKPTWRKKTIWKNYFHGPRIKCLDRPTNTEKGYSILNLCLKYLRLFKPNLTWIPRNRKNINIWEDTVLGDPPLSSMEGLD